MKYKKLEVSDIDAFVENRVEFAALIRDIKNVGEFKKLTKEYVEENIDSDNLIIYIAVDDDGNIASSAMLCIYQMIPLPSSLNGKCAELLNVYTKPQYRRQGHSAHLIKEIIKEAEKRDVPKIVLEYTDAGYPLYKSLGFKELDNQMVYKIR